METKYIKIPFDAEKAKKIQSGEIEGRIVTDSGNEVRIVCFDMLDDTGSIIGLMKNIENKETPYSFNEHGHCVQYSSIVLCIEVPEYMTFKDGDVIAFGLIHSITIGIFNKNTENNSHECYVVLNTLNHIYFDENGLTYENARMATKQEKQRLFNALKEKDDPRAKEYLERFFSEHSNSSNIGKDCELKPFDKVLVRDNDDCYWSADFFSYKDDDENMPYRCVSGWYKFCIPYQGNEHLLGTTESPQ